MILYQSVLRDTQLVQQSWIYWILCALTSRETEWSAPRCNTSTRAKVVHELRRNKGQDRGNEVMVTNSYALRVGKAIRAWHVHDGSAAFNISGVVLVSVGVVRQVGIQGHLQGENIRLYNLFSPVMMITWWMKLGGNQPLGDNPLLFSISGTGSSISASCTLLDNGQLWVKVPSSKFFCKTHFHFYIDFNFLNCNMNLPL